MIAAEAIRPQLISALRNLYAVAVVKSRTLEGLREHREADLRLQAEENSFCSIVKNLLDHGIEESYIYGAVDFEASLTLDHIFIFRVWVQTTLSRARGGFRSLGQRRETENSLDEEYGDNGVRQQAHAMQLR